MPDGEGFGFWDWVKKPWIRRAMERGRPGRAKPTVPPTPALLRKLVFGPVIKDREAYRETLKLSGPEANPILLEALRNPRVRASKPYGDGFYAPSPLRMVVEQLQIRILPEALPDLIQLLDHSDELVRREAAEAVGLLGDVAGADALGRSLTHPDPNVRSCAAIGVRKACNDGRATPVFREAMFDRVRPLINDPEDYPTERGTAALLALDQEGALAILLDPANFHARNEKLQRHLVALRETRTPVPFDRLAALVADLRPLVGEYPFEYTCREALLVLGQTQHPDAEAILLDAMTWGNEQVVGGAAGGLQMLAGVEEPYAFVWDRVYKDGFGKLTDPQRAYLILNLLDAEVCNGGFHQYYVNSYSENAHLAPAAATLVGAPDYLELIRKANACFGPDGPPSDRDLRHERLSRFTPGVDETLRKLDSEYYARPVKLPALLSLFAARHAEHFRA